MGFASIARSVGAAAALLGAAVVVQVGCSTTPNFIDDEGAGGKTGAGGATASGSPSGSGTSMSTASGGACKSPDDCKGDENECVQRTCTAGQCGLHYAAKD